MGLRQLASVAIVASVLTSVLTGDLHSQDLKNRRVLRWMGQGWAPAGYHHCNPGPNSDYYNPWNAQNSVRMTMAAEYPAASTSPEANSFYRYNQGGIPYSEYAAPNSALHGELHSIDAPATLENPTDAKPQRKSNSNSKKRRPQSGSLFSYPIDRYQSVDSSGRYSNDFVPPQRD